MASRYLLESGAPDGYQLEDGTGVLMLEQPRCYSATVIADSPVAYWRLGEASGTNANDEIGTLDGTYTGTVTLGEAGALTGDSNTAILMDATTEYVNIPDDPLIDFGNGPVSFEFWVKRAGIGAFAMIMDKYTQGQIYFDGSDFVGFNNNSAGIAKSSLAITDTTTWHHVVIARSGTGSGNTRVYIDGADVTTEENTALNLTTNTSEINLGRQGASPNAVNYTMNGRLDEFAIYNVMLTATQVATHYAAQSVACFVPYTNPYPPLIAQ